MKKYQRDIDTLTEAIDTIIARHEDESKLCISVSICIMGEGHEIERCELLQFGVTEACIMLLRESLSHTQQEDEPFIGNKIASITIN